MSTAMEAWGNAQTDDADDLPVHESEIVGGDAESFEEGPVAPEAEVGLESTLDDEAARRKKKGMQTIMIAVGACVVVLGGAVGMGVMKARANATSQPQIAANVQPAGPLEAPAAVPAVVAVAASAVDQVATERPDGSPLAGPAQASQGPDFGLQAAPVVPAGPIAPAPVALGNPQGPTAPQVPPAIEPVKHAALQPTITAVESKPDAAQAAEVEKLRAELAAARSELGRRDESIQRMQGEMSKMVAKLEARQAVRPQRAQPAAPTKPTSTKQAESTVAQADSSAAAPAAAPAPAPAVKSKVRSDFRIYAAVDGRVWVMGPDGEPTQIGPRSPLSDGTRVTGIDTDKNVVFTTAGEIH